MAICEGKECGSGKPVHMDARGIYTHGKFVPNAQLSFDITPGHVGENKPLPPTNGKGRSV